MIPTKITFFWALFIILLPLCIFFIILFHFAKKKIKTTLEIIRNIINGEIGSRFIYNIVKGYYKGRQVEFTWYRFSDASVLSVSMKPNKYIPTRTFYLIYTPGPTPDTTFLNGWVQKNIHYKLDFSPTWTPWKERFPREKIIKE